MAQALHELTGETEPLFAAAEAALAADVGGCVEGANALADLGAAAARLVPALRAALGRTIDRDTTAEIDADLALALALWRITGEASEVVPVLASVFDRSEGQRPLTSTAICCRSTGNVSFPVRWGLRMGVWREGHGGGFEGGGWTGGVPGRVDPLLLPDAGVVRGGRGRRTGGAGPGVAGR
ncbi:predicted protein [Streptomyces sp. C]|nr:predicted protein [Streptomyces sp. C]